MIEGELANNLFKDYGFDRISGGEIGFHSKMMISQGKSGQITMAYVGCVSDVESVV